MMAFLAGNHLWRVLLRAEALVWLSWTLGLLLVSAQHGKEEVLITPSGPGVEVWPKGAEQAIGSNSMVLPLWVKGRAVDMVFNVTDDLMAVAQAFVQELSPDNMPGVCAPGDTQCLATNLRGFMAQLPGFRRAHDAALGLSLETDSGEYEILLLAREMIAGQGSGRGELVPGLTCEIGVRRGGGSELIMRKGAQLGEAWRGHVAVDPFGDLPYQWREDSETGEVRPYGFGYNNHMRRKTLRDLHGIADDLAMDLHFFTMTDTDFFHSFSDGVPLYRGGERRVENRYALVHLDALHAASVLLDEMAFFGPRTPVGGVWVFDDIQDIELWEEVVHSTAVRAHGMSLVTKGTRKALYRKEALLLEGGRRQQQQQQAV